LWSADLGARRQTTKDDRLPHRYCALCGADHRSLWSADLGVRKRRRRKTIVCPTDIVRFVGQTIVLCGLPTLARGNADDEKRSSAPPGC